MQQIFAQLQLSCTTFIFAKLTLPQMLLPIATEQPCHPAKQIQTGSVG